MSKAYEMFSELGYKNTFSNFYEHDFVSFRYDIKKQAYVLVFDIK